jgi:hypothetical protein
VYQQDIFVGCGLRLDEVSGFGDPVVKKLLVNESVLLGRENVLANRQVVRVGVNELETQHSQVEPSRTLRNRTIGAQLTTGVVPIG